MRTFIEKILGIAKSIKDIFSSFRGEREIIISKSVYVDYEEGDKFINNIVTPLISDISENIRHVSTEKEFDDAIEYFKGSSNGCKIILDTDIPITNTKSLETINENNNLIIDGQKHKIYPKGKVYSGVLDDNKRYEIINYPISQNIRFMTLDGDALNLSFSKIYTAESQVTDSSGNEIQDNDCGYSLECRIKLPSLIKGIKVKSYDNVYINLSTWFVSEVCLVTRTDSTYLYFQYSGYYHPNGDYKFALKYPTFYLINKIGNRISGDILIESGKLYYPKEFEEICIAKSIIQLSIHDSKNKTLIKNLIVEGSSGGQEDINISNSCVVFDNCEFRNKADGYVISGGAKTQLYINNCYFHDLMGGSIFSASDSLCKVERNTFKRCGMNRTNIGCIKCEGEYCIESNIIEDYGYSAIIVGIINMSSDIVCQGVIQNNTIRQTPDYDSRMTIMDSGAIYVATNNNSLCIIRFNKIINYCGIYNNIGIFLDDGAYNTHIYSNLIEGVVNAYSISARYATGRNTGSFIDNVNKLIAQNITDKEILIEGITNTNNKCFLGTNIFTKDVMGKNIINNLQGQEKQIYSPTTKLENGILTTNLILDKWRISYE